MLKSVSSESMCNTTAWYKNMFDRIFDSDCTINISGEHMLTVNIIA